MKKIMSLALALCLALPAMAIGGFDDLQGYEWAENAILSMSGQGIVNGVGEGKFDPASGVTYEQLAKMVTLAFDLKLQETNTPTFSDVDQDRWSFVYIETAKPYFDKTGNVFSPDTQMTRAKVVTVIAKAIDAAMADPFYSAFSDSNEMSDETAKWVGAAVKLGIVTGYEDGSFRPNNAVSRAETAVLLLRAMHAAKPEATPQISASPTATPQVTPTPEWTAPPMATPEPENPEEVATQKARMDFFVVSNVARVSLDGEETVRVKGYFEGEEYTFTCERATVRNNGETVEAVTIAVGDVLSVVRDISGKVRNVQILFSVLDKYDGNNVVNPYEDAVKLYSSGNMKYYYGLVRFNRGNSIQLVYNDTIENNAEINLKEFFALNADTTVYEYNPNTKKIMLSDTSEIMEDREPSEYVYSDRGSFIFVRVTNDIANEVYIIQPKK